MGAVTTVPLATWMLATVSPDLVSIGELRGMMSSSTAYICRYRRVWSQSCTISNSWNERYVPLDSCCRLEDAVEESRQQRHGGTEVLRSCCIRKSHLLVGVRFVVCLESLGSWPIRRVTTSMNINTVSDDHQWNRTPRVTDEKFGRRASSF
jgi:hypothetical protein